MNSENELYDFCIENIHNLINGDLSINKIKKLRKIDYSFDYYIDCYLKEYKEKNFFSLISTLLYIKI